MSLIIHQIDNISVGLDKANGYINASKLCAAYSSKVGILKRPESWLRTTRATAYITYVASVTHFDATALVVVKQGGSDEQGTWIHPDLGNAFASWLSVEYEYAVSTWVQEWRSGKVATEFPDQITGIVPVDPATRYFGLVSSAIDTIFSHVDLELRTGMKIEGTCKKYPELREVLEPFKPKLILGEYPLVSPTKLGEMLEAKDGFKRTPMLINKLLIANNLQVATCSKNPAYRAIGRGVEFSKVVADTALGHGKTVQSLRWYESVLDLIEAV